LDDFDADDLGSIAASLAIGASMLRIDEVNKACSDLARDFRAFHPVRLAAAFGGLLTQTSLQSNCLRLEALVHLGIALGRGPRAATAQILTQGFASVGEQYGHFEDPAEDVFVGNIASKRGNYLVLEGIWESATFYLQRFVNLVDELPDQPYLNETAEAVHSLLKLSDLVCRRAGHSVAQRRRAHRHRKLRRRSPQARTRLESAQQGIGRCRGGQGTVRVLPQHSCA
jgi:hypothetical protein